MSAPRNPKPASFWLFAALGVASLLLLDLQFAPEWLAESDDGGGLPVAPEPSSNPAPSVVESDAPKPPSMPAAARVPTIVAKFTTESRDPVDENGIRALATAMIEDHEARVVLEGHSDTLGADDANHELSLARAELVKARLVELGVSEGRIETVGLGATHPLHSDMPDAASVNRRVEVRWIEKGAPMPTFEKRVEKPPVAPPVVMPIVDAAPQVVKPPIVEAAAPVVDAAIVEAPVEKPPVVEDQ